MLAMMRVSAAVDTVDFNQLINQVNQSDFYSLLFQKTIDKSINGRHFCIRNTLFLNQRNAASL